MNTYIIDTECYKNYWLFLAVNHKTGSSLEIELFGEDAKLSEEQAKKIERLLLNHETISFNGLNYDIPMICAAMDVWDCKKLHKLSTKIITSQKVTWQILREHKLNVPAYKYHIDIIELPIGQASLKIYGGRIHTKKMQDLPIDPNALIQDTERSLMRKYCRNDTQVTGELFDKLKGQIDLRKEMTTQYGINLNSKSDAQIAEAIIKSELQKMYDMSATKFKAKQYDTTFTFNYRNPEIIQFKTQALCDIFDQLLYETFMLKDNGSVELPQWLSKPITIGKGSYQMGIGGLHSRENAQHIKANDGFYLGEQDVASYYPSIILQQKLFPESMGKPFLDLYRGIVKKRITAKHTGDKVTADTLKILLNGSFGKFGSKYSSLYSPQLLLQTTITGQLSLLMLIEELELNGIQVVSANTDGIVTYYHESQIPALQDILFNWEITTSYTLEQTDYREIASRDVNNYIAVKLDGKTKCKGCFGEASLSKNPDGLIIYEAVAQFIANGTPIEKTVTDCDDIRKFVTVRRVTGGALFQGDYLGKAVRFYHSSSPSLADMSLVYVKNGNKVPMSQGCRPLMNLPDSFPDDVDFYYYYTKANEVLKGVGYA
jgi:hypothetical protein